MPRQGRKRRKTRTHVKARPEDGANTEENTYNPPKSFIVRHGRVGPEVSRLVTDLRAVFSPYTATSLRERAKSSMKDYAVVAAPLGVTHLLVLSQTEKTLQLRISRAPQGPTLSFRVLSYSLAGAVRGSQKRPADASAALFSPPLVILNNFSSEEEDGKDVEQHIKLAKVTLQHMFPTIDVANVPLAECRRVVLFHLDRVTKEIEMRHYLIKASPTGVCRAVKKVMQSKTPDLHRLGDISEFVQDGMMAGGASDSEVEDEDSHVSLPDRYAGRGNVRKQTSAIRLKELGPRISMSLVKVVKGLGEGDVLYHSFITKTDEEVSTLTAAAEEAKELKRQRRAEQQENVARKKAVAAEVEQARKKVIATRKTDKEAKVRKNAYPKA
eukprot:307245_1